MSQATVLPQLDVFDNGAQQIHASRILRRCQACFSEETVTELTQANSELLGVKQPGARQQTLKSTASTWTRQNRHQAD